MKIDQVVWGRRHHLCTQMSQRRFPILQLPRLATRRTLLQHIRVRLAKESNAVREHRSLETSCHLWLRSKKPFEHIRTPSTRAVASPSRRPRMACGCAGPVSALAVHTRSMVSSRMVLEQSLLSSSRPWVVSIMLLGVGQADCVLLLDHSQAQRGLSSLSSRHRRGLARARGRRPAGRHGHR